jgi:hypothetical protein
MRNASQGTTPGPRTPNHASDRRSDQCALRFPGPWQVACGEMANQLTPGLGGRAPRDLVPLGWVLRAHGAMLAHRFLRARSETSGASSCLSEPQQNSRRNFVCDSSLTGFGIPQLRVSASGWLARNAKDALFVTEWFGPTTWALLARLARKRFE